MKSTEREKLLEINIDCCCTALLLQPVPVAHERTFSTRNVSKLFLMLKNSWRKLSNILVLIIKHIPDVTLCSFGKRGEEKCFLELCTFTNMNKSFPSIPHPKTSSTHFGSKRFNYGAGWHHHHRILDFSQ